MQVESGRVADRFIAGLSAASRRGVQVYLLLDAFGSLWLRNKERRRLELPLNLEANQEIRDPALVQSVMQLFEADFACCREFNWEQWRCRPWYLRLRERVWGGVIRLLQWFSSLKRHRGGPVD